MLSKKDVIDYERQHGRSVELRRQYNRQLQFNRQHLRGGSYNKIISLHSIPGTVWKATRDGNTYEGQLSDTGEMHGQGKYTRADGKVFEGEWEHGQPADDAVVTTLKGDFIPTSISYSPDGKYLLTAGDRDAMEGTKGAIQLWSMGEYPSLEWTINGEDKWFHLNKVMFLPTGTHFAVSVESDGDESRIEIWDVKSKKRQTFFDFDIIPVGDLYDFSSDGKYLAVGGLYYLSIFNVDSGVRILHRKVHDSFMSSVAFSPRNMFRPFGDSRDRWPDIIATSCAGTPIRFWKNFTSDLVMVEHTINGARWPPAVHGGAKILFGKMFQVYYRGRGQRCQIYNSYGNEVSMKQLYDALSITPDDLDFQIDNVALSRDETQIAFRMETYDDLADAVRAQIVIGRFDNTRAATPSLTLSSAIDVGISDRYTSMAFSPDGRFIVHVDSDDPNKIKFSSIETRWPTLENAVWLGTNILEGSTRVYEGRLVRGKMYGQGKYTFSRKEKPVKIYEGEWVDDQPHGKGTLTFASGGRVFKGNFENGLLIGEGTFTGNPDRNGNSVSYDGNFSHPSSAYRPGVVNAVIHGEGVYTYRNGNEYDGMFKQNNQTGAGKFTFAADDSVWYGEWKNGEPVGRGTWHVNGEWFRGRGPNKTARSKTEPRAEERERGGR